MVKKVIKNLNISIVLFIVSLVSSFSIGNLYYLSTQSPDFVRYRNYIDYFLFGSSDLKLEQGFIYFIIISFFISKRISDFSIYNENIISNLGNKTNFSYNNLDHFEIAYNLGIQEGNFSLYIIGLIGFYKFLIIKGYKSNKIFYSFSILNFLPVMLAIRLTLKPEIIAFSLLPWVLLSLEKYLKTKNIKYLAYGVILFSTIISSKASIALMCGLYVLLNYFNILKNFNKKDLFKILLVMFLTSGILMYENFKLTGLNILTRESANDYFGQTEYDNKASLSFVYYLSPEKIVKKPYKDFHANSLIGITILDSFNDYFNLYWNKDYSLFKIDRKNFIQVGKNSNFIFDSSNDILFLPKNFNFNLEMFRIYLSALISVIFYFYLFHILTKRKHDFKLYLGPFIGVFVLLLSSFGIPENNFDPNVGDTVKTFYYGFLFAISFTLLIIKILSYKKFINILIVISSMTVFLFIFGFPKANNSYLDYSLSKVNKVTVFCEINKFALNTMLLENKGLDCDRTGVERVCNNLENVYSENNIIFTKDKYEVKYSDIKDCIILLNSDYEIQTLNLQIKNVPIFNRIYLIILLISLILLSDFNIKKNKKKNYNIKK